MSEVLRKITSYKGCHLKLLYLHATHNTIGNSFIHNACTYTAQVAKCVVDRDFVYINYQYSDPDVI